tara:strand:+ start:8369 stop:8938 length:570 start_codon:yes stop_codon:yes gene_type:complete
MNFDLRDYIIVLENIIPHELCDEVIDEYKNDDYWINTTVRSDAANRELRRCDAIDISDNFIIEKNQEKRKNIDDKLFVVACDAIQKYNDKFGILKIQTAGDSGYTLLRYREGAFYSQHTDHFLQAPRTVSCSFTLNDNFEGGEFGFFNRELTYNPPKGSAIMFPSNFLYPHETMPVKRHVRYSIITWFI